jgi:hypothetical protein
MSDKKIKCPFCEGVAAVKKNARLDPFISCQRCGPINARGAMYRAYIEKRQYEPAAAASPPAIEAETKPLYKQPVSTKAKEDWLDDWNG